MEHGIRHMKHGTRHKEHGTTWHGTWHTEHRAWSMARVLCSIAYAYAGRIAHGTGF